MMFIGEDRSKGGGMSTESWIRIALVVLVVLVVVALVVFGIATRPFVEESEPPPLKPAQSSTSVEEGIAKTRQEIKDTQQELETRTKGGNARGTSKEIQEACEKAKLDLINGTAKEELDADQRVALEGVIARQCD
jgi:cytoskeletal protein RodZ